jgi:hypothetical protein
MPRKDDFTMDMDDSQSAHSYTADAVYKLPISNKKQALAAISSKEIRIGAFVWTPVGLQIDGQINREDWEETGKLLNRLDISLQWLIGDWVVAAEALGYGDRQEFAEQIGFATQTIYDYSYVARNVEFSIRIENLDFGHHQLVASMDDPEKQRHWLERALAGDDGKKRWSVARLRQEIAGNRLLEKPTKFVKALETVNALKKQSDGLQPHEKRELVSRIRELLAEIDK